MVAGEMLKTLAPLRVRVTLPVRSAPVTLTRQLVPYGFACEVALQPRAHPQERFQVTVSCTPLPLAGVPAEVSEVSAQRALTAVRAAIGAAAREMDAADLALWKRKLEAQVSEVMASPGGFVSTLLARYSINKDLTSRYKESISGVTAAQVQQFLQAIAAGGRVEYVVP